MTGGKSAGRPVEKKGTQGKGNTFARWITMDKESRQKKSQSGGDSAELNSDGQGGCSSNNNWLWRRLRTLHTTKTTIIRRKTQFFLSPTTTSVRESFAGRLRIVRMIIAPRHYVCVYLRVSWGKKEDVVEKVVLLWEEREKYEYPGMYPGISVFVFVYLLLTPHLVRGFLERVTPSQSSRSQLIANRIIYC